MHEEPLVCGVGLVRGFSANLELELMVYPAAYYITQTFHVTKRVNQSGLLHGHVWALQITR